MVGVVVVSAMLVMGDEAMTGTNSACAHTLERAGRPELISKIARPTNTARYCGYWVGGGCGGKRAEERDLREEGTFGWDYGGSGLLPRRIALGWWHGRRSQGGTG